MDFRINRQIWHLNIVPPTFSQLLASSGNFTLGSCDNKTKNIYIADGLSDFKFRKVLCHELTHAAMFSYDVQLTLDQEELLADIISTYGNEIVYITNKVFRKIKNRDRY